MSIAATLAQRLADGRLHELESLFTGDETARSMYVSPLVRMAVTPPFPDTLQGKRLGELRAWLDDFMECCELTVAEDPANKPTDTMLARVHPVEEEFWAIRVTEPPETPGIRAFGAFASQDAFVALTWEYREEIGEFDEEVDAAIASWIELFDPEEPFSGASLDE